MNDGETTGTMKGKHAIVCRAIATRSCVLAYHRGGWIVLSPHAFGWRDGEAYLVSWWQPEARRTGGSGWVALPLRQLFYVRLWATERWQAGRGPRPAVELRLEAVAVVPENTLDARSADAADEKRRPGRLRHGGSHTRVA